MDLITHMQASFFSFFINNKSIPFMGKKINNGVGILKGTLIDVEQVRAGGHY